MQKTYVQLLNVRTGKRQTAHDVSHLTQMQQTGFIEAIRTQAKASEVVDVYKATEPRTWPPTREMPKTSETTAPVPCAHIADYYSIRWNKRPTIGDNFLRFGYLQWSEGRPSAFNNLYCL